MDRDRGTSAIVTVKGLSKRYGDFWALSDCGLTVDRGNVFGLLGPNGAGKTTLIRLLLGYLQPTHGEIQVHGYDPAVDGVSLRRHVAYLPGDARLPRHMRGDAVLRFFADLHPGGNLDRSLQVADTLELATRTRVALMSTGMRQKLALAVVFAVDTPLLILDEPTANLDPTVRARVLELVGQAKREGRTVMFSSHVLSEIEEACDQVVFLRQGKVAHRLKMSELFQRHRITAWAQRPIETVPKGIRSSVHLETVPDEKRFAAESQSPVMGKPVSMVTDGDLAPLLSWLDALGLSRVRIEPLGLRSVYDSVHFLDGFDAEAGSSVTGDESAEGTGGEDG